MSSGNGSSRASMGWSSDAPLRFIFVQRIQNFIWLPLYHDLQNTSGVKFMYTSGFEPFMLTMKIGALAGLMLAVPFILYQLWLFIAPGLYSHEKKMAAPFVVFCTTFFAMGAAFSHYVAFPWTWKFFLGWQTEYMEFRPSIGEAFGLYVEDAAWFRPDLPDADDRVLPRPSGSGHGRIPPSAYEIRHPDHLHHRRGHQPWHRRGVAVPDGRTYARVVRCEHFCGMGLCQTAHF